ncbi:MAG TPA: aldehyde dehydrogenase family protein [Candidatus Limnocylindria bacterium]|nr:aldehyde dehydrogenase family protein [Candidatus Limnocylindria bacterium]
MATAIKTKFRVHPGNGKASGAASRPQPPISSRVQSFVRGAKKNLIDGKWVSAASAETFPVFNPATGEVIAQCASGAAEDINRAVIAARRAFESGAWRRLSPSERGRMIWRLGDLILEHADELAEIESLDNGKPRTVARVADVPLAADLFHYMAGWATKIEGHTIPISVPYAPGARFHAFTKREPIGVIGQIIPWNFPLLMAAWKLGPALATGNCIVLKPAEQTPLSALRLAELALEAGLPPGVLNVVTGYGETAGAALAAHPDVDKIAFTGSTEVGKLIVKAAAGNLKKVSLELGGKSPNVVFRDVGDLDQAIAGAANAIFFNHGQCCCAGSRLMVEKGIFDQVVEGVAAHAKKIKLGPGLDANTQMGPLVSEEQFHRLTHYMNAGRQDGACVMTGGERHGTRGYFVKPTVIKGVHANMSVVREEIFGPVVVAEPFSDLDDLVRRANETNYGLAAGVWTRDISKAHLVAEQLRAGTVWINCYNVFDAALPFGGYKQSGWGREMGHEALELYTETKAVVIGL